MTKKPLYSNDMPAVMSRYRNQKSVFQNLPVKDVDKVEGGIWPFLIPLLGALGAPVAGAAGKWIGSKIFGKGVGGGLLRAGDKRGAGIFQAGSVGRGLTGKGYEPDGLPEETKDKKRCACKNFKSGDLALPTRYVKLVGAGVPDIAKLQTKLKPFLAANDVEGFKNKLIRYASKRVA